MKTLLMAAASLAVVAAPVAASAQGHGHGGYGHGGYSHGYRGGRGDGGGMLAAGLFGLVLGSAIASSSHSYDYGYERPYGYGERCVWRNQAYDVGYGQVEYRQVEVCR
jgi:opacity protein-like surface antigen